MEPDHRIKIANNRLVSKDQPVWSASAAALLIMIVAWPHVAPAMAMTTFAILLLADAQMSLIFRLFWRDKARDDHADFWDWCLFGGNLFAGTLWGIVCALLFLFLPQVSGLLVGLIMSLVIGGWTIAQIPSNKCIMGFSLPATTALTTAIILDGNASSYVIALAVPLFMIVVLKHTRLIADAYRASIELSDGLQSQVEREAEKNEIVRRNYSWARQMLEALPVPVGLTRRSNGELIYINQYGRNILGIKDLAEDPKNLKNGFIADRESRDQVYNKVTSGETIHELELRMKRNDGSEFWALFSGSDIMYEGQSVILGVFPDITERRAAKEELERNEEKLRLLTDHASDLITIWEPKKGFTYVSPSVRHLLGYQPDEFAATKLQDFIHPEDLKTHSAANFDSIENGTLRKSYIYRILHKSGHWEWMEASSSIGVARDTGKFTQISTVSRLVTERVEHEAELSLARERAEKADRAKSDFLAHMSHEIRTPLNAVIGFAEVMRDQLFGPLGSPRYEEYINDIYKSGTHLLELINDVLDLSKVEAGNFELQEDRVELEAIVETAMRFVKDRSQAKQIVLLNRLHDAPDLWCDRRVMIQVMLNLIGNAVKFTPDRGRITVEALLNSEGCLEISVTDTGIGIAPEDIPVVMRPFGQARTSSETAAAEPGTGLGLPLAKSFIEKHGGYFILTSEVGIGTRVTITLPASRVMMDGDGEESIIAAV